MTCQRHQLLNYYCNLRLSLLHGLQTQSPFLVNIDSIKTIHTFILMVLLQLSKTFFLRVGVFGHGINKFSNFSCRFLNPKYFFSNLNYIFCNVFDLINLQKQVKKVFCFKNCTNLSLHCSNKLIGDFKNLNLLQYVKSS